MKNKLNVFSFIEIFTKYILILILFTGILFIPTIYLVNSKAKLYWNIKFKLHLNEDIIFPYISKVMEHNEDNYLLKKSIDQSQLFNQSYFGILKEVSSYSKYVVAQNLRNNDIQFSVIKNKFNSEIGNFIMIDAIIPADIKSESEIKNYLKKLEKDTSKLLSYLLQMEYKVDIYSAENTNLLDFRIKSLAFIDNKNLLLLKSFIICLVISYSLIFMFVNRKKIRFI